MPRKNVPGGKKTPAKPFYSEGNDTVPRRKRIEKDPKYKKKAWLDEIEEEEYFDIFDRETESE